MEPARKSEPPRVAIDVPYKAAPPRTAAHDRALEACFAEIYPEGPSEEGMAEVAREWAAQG